MTFEAHAEVYPVHRIRGDDAPRWDTWSLDDCGFASPYGYVADLHSGIEVLRDELGVRSHDWRDAELQDGPSSYPSTPQPDVVLAEKSRDDSCHQSTHGSK